MKKYIILIGLFILSSGNLAYSALNKSLSSPITYYLKYSFKIADNKDVTLSRPEAEQQEQTNKVKNLSHSTSKNSRHGKKKLEEPKVKEPDYYSGFVNSNKGTSNVLSVKTNVTELQLVTGQNRKISAYTAFRDGSTLSNMRWKSSNQAIVKVDKKGNVKAIGKGKAFIIVSSLNDFSKKQVIKVTIKS